MKSYLAGILHFFRLKVESSLTKPLLNCWFCNEDCDNEYELEREEQGWFCPSCQQYNGFKEDGDYDQPIAEQHDMPKEDKRFCQKQAFATSSSVLCEACNRNQVLKVGQLASFVPLMESMYNVEVESYADYLESVYRLCRPCQDKVSTYLDAQNSKLVKKLDGQVPQTMKQQEFVGTSEENSPHCVKTLVRLWSRLVLFSLCSAMAAVNVLYVGRLFVELSKDRLCGFLSPQFQPYFQVVMEELLPLPVYQASLQLPVYFGSILCLLSLLTVGKTCVYIVDAVHVVLWLLLLIGCAVSSTHSLSSSHVHGVVLGMASPAHLFLSLATVCVSCVCLGRSRTPRSAQSLCPQRHTTRKHKPQADKQYVGVREEDAFREDNPVEASPTVPPLAVVAESSFSSFALSSSSSSISSSPLPARVGEAHNFFKPITLQSTRGSPSSLSSASPVSQGHVMDTCEAVRHNLESFSFGFGSSKGSVSSVWSFPSIVSTDADTSPDSTVSANIRMDPRNILSPSRLSFLSLSASPSPGKFSSPVPSSEADSGFVADTTKHGAGNVNQDSQSADTCVPRGPASSSLFHLSTFHSCSPHFQDYRSVRSKPISPTRLEGEEFLSLREKIIAVPDSSTPNGRMEENEERQGLRRSHRIAMRGKIIKPWPLKKSLSVNDMYDRSGNRDVVNRQRHNDTQLNLSGTEVRSRGSGGFSLYKSLESEVGSENSRCDSSRLYWHEKNRRQGHRRAYPVNSLDRVAEFSDDDDDEKDMEAPCCHKVRQSSRGLVKTAGWQPWVWAVSGVVIGVSLTVNAFLLWSLSSSHTVKS